MVTGAMRKRLPILVSLVVLISVLAFGYMYYNDFIERRCDSLAREQARSLSRSLSILAWERGISEKRASSLITLERCNCPDLQIGREQVPYLIGPAYGWSGTSGRLSRRYKCEVLLRLTGGEARICARNGKRYKGGERKVFRVSLRDGSFLGSEMAQCEGEEFPVVDCETRCYEGSMIDHLECVFKEPPYKLCVSLGYQCSGNPPKAVPLKKP